MKKSFMFLILLLAILINTGATFPSKNIVDYRIKAKLSPEEKIVFGEEALTWLNTGDIPVSELNFHLYLNAFKNNRSTFMRESGGSHRGFALDKDRWGYIDV